VNTAKYPAIWLIGAIRCLTRGGSCAKIHSTDQL
jgi:hypothetical protein